MRERERQARLRADPAWLAAERIRCAAKDKHRIRRPAPPPSSHDAAFCAGINCSMVTTDQLRRPRLYFLDAQGGIRAEDYLSADQLIAAYKRKDTSA
jgi:hypothetical protein